MSEEFRLVHLPLRLLVRNEFNTQWNAFGPNFDDFHDLVQYVRASRISLARKRIVQVWIRDRREHGEARFRMTTVWEGTRLSSGMGKRFTVEAPEYPRDYDGPG
jgi:hypothetical protein